MGEDISKVFLQKEIWLFNSVMDIGSGLLILDISNIHLDTFIIFRYEFTIIY